MTQPRQKLSAFFRDQRTFRVIDGFLLLLPWVLSALILKEVRLWVALFGLSVIIVLLWLDRPWFSQRYLISAGGLGVCFLSPIPFFAVAFFVSYVVGKAFRINVFFLPQTCRPLSDADLTDGVTKIVYTKLFENWRR